MSRFSEKTEGLLNWTDLKSVKGKLIYAIFFINVLLIALVCLIPVVWMFVSAFKTPEELYAIPPKLLPSKVDFSVIGEIWGKAHIGKHVLNTLVIIVGCWISEILISGTAGYVLAKLRPMGTKLISNLLFITMMLPGISMVPLYMTFVEFPIGHFSMIGTFFPLWIMAATGPFNIFLFRNFFNSIPTAYIEAARIDGYSDIMLFLRIVLPLSKPILAVVTIFSVIGSWSNFLWPYLILGQTEFEPVSVMLYNLTSGATSFQVNEQLLIMMIATIPSIIVFAIFSKQIMGGLNMSGIKG